MRFTCLRICLPATLLLGTLARSAQAEAARLPIAVEYSAIETCPTRAAFWDALSTRSDRVVEATQEEATAVLQVNIILTSQGVLGRLQVVRDGVSTEPRFVEAADCEQVVNALALTAALSIDAEAQAQTSEPLAPVAPMPEPEPETTYTDRTLDAAPSTPGRDSDRYEPQVYTAMVAASLLDNDVNLGVGAGFNVTRYKDGEPLQTFGLAAGHSQTSGLLQDQANLSLTWAELSGCIVALDRGLRARACLLFQGGVLHAGGRNLTDALSTEQSWWAPGLAIQAETPTPSYFKLHLGLSVVVPLKPQTYQRGVPPETFAATVPVSVAVALGGSFTP